MTGVRISPTTSPQSKDQRKNYERRIKGAKRLRTFVDKHALRQISIPRKWLLELPGVFSRKEAAYVLVVEHLALIGDDQTKAAYSRMEPELLAALCLVVFHFRGMDSNIQNMPLGADGRLAFIDTEHWDRHSSKTYLHLVSDYLASDRRKLVKRIFAQLEDNDGVVRNMAGLSSDFDDEADTRSSSS